MLYKRVSRCGGPEQACWSTFPCNEHHKHSPTLTGLIACQDVVKDILAFADTGAGDEALPEVPFDLQNGRADSPVPSMQSSEGTDNSALTG